MKCARVGALNEVKGYAPYLNSDPDFIGPLFLSPIGGLSILVQTLAPGFGTRLNTTQPASSLINP